MINGLSSPFTSIHFLLPPAIKFYSIFMKSFLNCLFSFLKSNVLKDEVEQTNITCVTTVLFPQSHPIGIAQLSKIYDVSLIQRSCPPAPPPISSVILLWLPKKSTLIQFSPPMHAISTYPTEVKGTGHQFFG